MIFVYTVVDSGWRILEFICDVEVQERTKSIITLPRMELNSVVMNKRVTDFVTTTISRMLKMSSTWWTAVLSWNICIKKTLEALQSP